MLLNSSIFIRLDELNTQIKDVLQDLRYFLRNKYFFLKDTALPLTPVPRNRENSLQDFHYYDDCRW